MSTFWIWLQTWWPCCCTGYLVLLAPVLMFIYGAYRNDRECKPKLYPMFCAWCRKDGKVTELEQRAGVEGSSGICPACERKHFGKAKREWVVWKWKQRRQRR